MGRCIGRDVATGWLWLHLLLLSARHWYIFIRACPPRVRVPGGGSSRIMDNGTDHLHASSQIQLAITARQPVGTTVILPLAAATVPLNDELNHELVANLSLLGSSGRGTTIATGEPLFGVAAKDCGELEAVGCRMAIKDKSRWQKVHSRTVNCFRHRGQQASNHQQGR